MARQSVCAWGGGVDKANGQTKSPFMVLVNFHSSRIARFVKIPWLVHRQQSKEGSLSAVVGCSAQEMRTLENHHIWKDTSPYPLSPYNFPSP